MRAPPGEGTWYTQNGYQCWKIVHDGKRYVRTSKSLRKLQTKVKAVKAALEAGGDPNLKPVKPAPAMTLGEWLDQWLEDYVKPPNREAKTYRQYEQFVRLYIKPELGNVPLDQLEAHQCESLFKKLRREGKTEYVKLEDGKFLTDKAGNKVTKKGPMSPASVDGVRRVLKAALNRAKRSKKLTSNPVEDTDPISGVKERTRVVKPEHAGKLTAELLQEPMPGKFKWFYGPLILTIMTAGGRISEILGLSESEDVIYEDGQVVALKLEFKLEWTDSENWKRSDTKGKKLRIVPLSKTGREAVSAQLRQLARMRREVPQDRVENGLLFTTTTGSPCNDRNVQRSLDAILVHLGMPHVSLHDLRRTYGTLLARVKTPDHILKSLMGHASIATTKKHYTIVLDSDAADAVNVLDKVFAAKEEA